MADVTASSVPHSPPSSALSAIEAAFERATDAIFVLSGDGTVRAANEAARGMLAVPNDAVVGRQLWDLFGPIAKPEDVAWFRKSIAQALVQGSRSRPFEHRFEHRSGDRVTVWLLRVAPVVGSETDFIVAEAHDVTSERQRRTEEQLLKDLAFALGET